MEINNDIETFDDFKPADEMMESANPIINDVFQKELSEVEEYKQDYDSELLMYDDPKGELTSQVVQYIQESGEVDEVNIASYTKGERNKVAIDGWNFNGDEDLTSIDLFLTIYKDSEIDGPRLNRTELDTEFKKMKRFFDQSKSGKLLKDLSDEDRKSDLYQIAQLINDTKKIDRLRLYIMTNAIIPSNYNKDNEETEDGTIEYNVWDIKRVMQQDRILSGKDPIIVNFDADYNCPLPCIKMPDISKKVECYLCIIPGTVLAQIYHKYHQQILEMNVRTFLQFKGASNKGIRDTLIGHHPTAAQLRKGDTEREPEPDMFFSYNNGISTTASEVDVEMRDSGPVITAIKDWQIVNGGQTTASISTVMGMKDVDKTMLSKVYVSMKVSVIKEKDEINDIVPLISRFANTQSAVKKSDFNINEPFLVELEQLSRTEWALDDAGKPVSKWFFERTRGQYMDMLKRNPTKKLENEFLAEYPKNQMFDKTMLSKYMMAWMQDPRSVCNGGEKNYQKFFTRMHQLAFHFDKSKFHRTIAKAIIFKTIEAYYGKNGIALVGYKSNMVAYTMSALSMLSKKALDLNSIWKEQFVISQNVLSEMTIEIPTVYAKILCGQEHVTYKTQSVYTDNDGKRKKHYATHEVPTADIQKIKGTVLYKVMEFVKRLEPFIWDHLVTVDEGVNIGEWTKGPGCWESLRIKLNEKDDFQMPAELLSASGDTDEDITDAQKKVINNAEDVSAEEWWSINKWAKETHDLTPRETAFIGQLGYRIKRGFEISYKQARWAMQLREKAISKGWEME